MVEEIIEKKIEAGIVKLKKPLAGPRNDAAIKADTAEGFKKTIFFTELLPSCIAEHPWGTTKIGDALRKLSTKEYDELLGVLREFDVDSEDIKKKPEE